MKKMIYDELAKRCPELFKVIDKKIEEKDAEVKELKEKVTEQNELINQLIIETLGGE